jgi:signal transduction histidine kinase
MTHREDTAQRELERHQLQEQVFGPLFPTRPPDQGTGLALSIRDGIIREQKGRLWSQSAPGESLLFHIELKVDNVRPTPESALADHQVEN